MANVFGDIPSDLSFSSGQLLRWNGSAWEAFTPTSGITIGSTSISSGNNNRVLFQLSGAVSQDADFTFDSSNNRLTIGSAILQTPNSNSLFLGSAPDASYSGNTNVFVGNGAGGTNTIQYGNTHVGSGAGATTSGDAYFNTFVGTNTGTAATGRSNTFVGWNAGSANTSGYQNTFIGWNVGSANVSGANSTFVGYGAGQANTANNGVAFGYQAGASNTSGIENAFVGVLAGYQTTTGQGNAFFGAWAGQANTTGNYGVFIGQNAGYSSTGDGNTFVGRSAGTNITSGTYNCMIGYGVQADSATGSYQTNINDTFTATSTEARIVGRDFKLDDAKNFVFGTTTGTKIGTASTQKIGFYGVTPVTQRTLFGGITDATGGTSGTTINIDDGMGGIDVAELNNALATIINRINAGRTIFSQTGIAV